MATRIFQSMLSGTRALDPVVLSGVIAALLLLRFWLASLPHSRLTGYLAVVLECIVYLSGKPVTRPLAAVIDPSESLDESIAL